MRPKGEGIAIPCSYAIPSALGTKTRKSHSYICSSQNCRYQAFRVALPFVDCWQLTMVVATHSHTKNDSFFMAVQVIRVGRTRQEELVSRFCGQGCKVEEGV